MQTEEIEIPAYTRLKARGGSFEVDLVACRREFEAMKKQGLDGDRLLDAAQAYLEPLTGFPLALGEVDWLVDYAEEDYAKKKIGRAESIAATVRSLSSTDSPPSD